MKAASKAKPKQPAVPKRTAARKASAPPRPHAPVSFNVVLNGAGEPRVVRNCRCRAVAEALRRELVDRYGPRAVRIVSVYPEA